MNSRVIQRGRADYDTVWRDMQAFTLARVRSWFLLEAPPGGRTFPYRLAFRRHQLADAARQPRQRRGRKGLIGVSAISAEPSGRIGPCAEKL